MTEFEQLLNQSGLSMKGAAELLHRDYGTIWSYKSGRRNAPPEVIKKMKACVRAHEKVF